MSNTPKNKNIRYVAALLCILLSLCSLAACRNNTPPAQTPSDQPTETYEPYVLPEPTFTEDSTDYRALALAPFENVEIAPATDFTYELTDSGTVRLTAYTGEGGVVILPAAIDGKVVTTLGEGLFKDSETLTALSIPACVSDIGPDLLTGCRTIRVLRTPQLSATRGETGYLAYFFGADTAQGMGFKVSSSLDTVILQDTVTEISDLAFMDCSRLRMVLLPDTLTSIGNFAFSGCSQLHFVPLPASLKTVGDYAFENCKALISVSLGSAVERIGLGAYMGCTSLEHITLSFIGESRESESRHLGYIFGAEAYTWNTGYVPEKLAKVTLTEGNVPDYAFYECDRLALVELPDGCESIGVRAFFGCDVLRRISFPETLKSVGELAFAHCTVLGEVEFNYGLQTIGLQAFFDCYSLTEITLPDSLTSLPNSAFADCRCLRSVALGKSMSTIGDMAFRNCSSLEVANGGTSDMTVGLGNSALTDVWQLGPSDKQIEAATRAADHALLKPRADGSTIDITIDLSDKKNLFPSIASQQYYERLYERSLALAAERGIDPAGLMDIDHIKWEYELHLWGYRSGNEAIKARCEKIDLNVEETVWTMIEKGLGVSAQ